MSYRQKIGAVIIFLVFLTFLGLTVVSVNMERNTQRHGQDFLYFTTKSEGLWEIRFLGTSLVIDKAEIESRTIKKMADYIQERWQWLKNRQEAVYPIK